MTIAGQLDLLDALDVQDLGRALGSARDAEFRAEFDRRTATPDGIGRRCWLCGDVELREAGLLEGIEGAHGLKPDRASLAATFCRVQRIEAHRFIVRASQDRNALYPDERERLRKHLLLTGRTDLLHLVEAKESEDELTYVTGCLLGGSRADDISSAVDRLAEALRLAEWYSDGQAGMYAPGRPRVRCGKTSVVVYDRITGGNAAKRDARITRILAGKLKAKPEDEVRLYSYPDIAQRAVELADAEEALPAEEPRPICDCHADHDFHPRHSDGCTGGDPRISRTKPWGPTDEAARKQRQAASRKEVRVDAAQATR